MPFAYVTDLGASIHKEGRTLSVRKEGKTLAEWEMVHLQGLILLGPVNITTPAMVALLHQRLPTAFLNTSGQLQGRLVPPQAGNVQLRLAQYRLAQAPGDDPARLSHARAVVLAKIAGMMDLLNRHAANYPELPLTPPRQSLGDRRRDVEQVSAIASLLGIEGAAAAAYWAAFPSLNRSSLPFNGRSTRPPRDPVNALLSFGYVLLANEIRSLLDILGFDPYLGFYHQTAANRPALALDLIEPFRHCLIDRMVLRAINLGRFRSDDFTPLPEGGFNMSREALQGFIGDYEKAMQQIARDPADGWRGSWREIIHRRCQQLAHDLTAGRPGMDRLLGPAVGDNVEDISPSSSDAEIWP